MVNKHIRSLRKLIHRGLLVFILFSFSAPSVVYGAESGPQSTNAYEVQPGDIVNISVWQEPDLQLEALVRPDGRFSMPLAGEMMVKGKTIQIIRQEIIKKLQDYIPDIDVMVSVNKLSGNKIYVVGKVNRPGEFSSDRQVDVMQALTLAAGGSKFADLDEIKILRRNNNNVQIAIPFNYTEVEQGKNLEQNIMLHNGDIVIVP